MEQKLKVREAGGLAEPHTALYAQSWQSAGHRGGRGRGFHRGRGGTPGRGSSAGGCRGLSITLNSEVATPAVVGGLLVVAVDLLAAPSSAKFVANIIMLRGTAGIGLITLILDRLHRHLKRSMLQTLLNQMVIGS